MLAASAPHEPAIRETVPEFARGVSDAGPRGDLVHTFDWMVGRVVEALIATGELEDTLLLVTSDNGALPGHSASIDGHPPWYDFGHASCGEWRGYKSHIWEGGHREPCIVHWPSVVPAGTSSDVLATFVDFLPSIASIVSGAVPLPEGAAEDGVDLSHELLGVSGEEASTRAAGAESRPVVHHAVFGQFAVRSGDWKLIVGTQGSGGWPPPSDGPPDWDGPGQLYDLGADPGERIDLFSERPEVVDRLVATLLRQRVEEGGYRG